MQTNVTVRAEDTLIERAKEFDDFMDRKSRETLKKNGMTIDPVSKEFRKELNAIGDKLRAEWAQKAGADAQAILKEYYRITGR